MSSQLSTSAIGQFSNNFTVPKMSTVLKDELNYPEWANEAETYLTVMDLFEIVDGTIPCPDTTTGTSVSNDRGLWRKASMKAKLFMMFNCEEGPKSTINLCTTAKEAWESLRSSYEGKTRTNLHFLLTAITNLKYDDRNTNIDSHITEFEKRWSRLSATTKSSTDTKSAAGVLHLVTNCETLKANLLLGTLPSFYSNIVDNITTKSDISYADTTVRLRELVPRKKPRKSESTDESPTPAAFASNTTSSSTNPWNNGKVCTYCKNNKGWSGRGHTESECRNKKRDEQISRQQAHTAEEYVFMSQSHPQPEQHNKWSYDTEASTHMTPFKSLLTDTVECQVPVRTASGWTTSYLKGTARLEQNGQTILLADTLYIPALPKNLLSGQRFRQKGAYTYLDNNPRIEKDGITILRLHEQNGKFTIDSSQTTEESNFAGSSPDWHERYGHLPYPSFIHVKEAPPALHGYNGQCDACQQGKSVKAASPQQNTIRTSRPLELVHSDLCGPMKTRTPSQHIYLITLVDDFSRLTLVRTIAAKSDTANELLSMIAALETSAGAKVKSLKTDNGGEYRSDHLMHELKMKGIEIKQTVPYHSQTNPVAERTNRTLVTMGRTALLHSKLPRSLWGEAVQHCAYTKNRTPHRAHNGRSPLEIFQADADIVAERSNFRAFGEKVWVHQLEQTDKLAPRAKKGVIVGYTTSHKTFRVWTEDNKIVVTKSPRHRSDETTPYDPLILPVFGRNNPFINDKQTTDKLPLSTTKTEHNKSNPRSIPDEWWRSTAASSAPDRAQNMIESSMQEESQEIPTIVGSFPESQPRRSERHKKSPERYGYETANVVEASPSLEQALKGPNADEWRKAMEEEKTQMRKYAVYEEVDDVPPGKRVVDTKWVLKEKRDEHGNLIRRKARLTGRGFMQTAGIDFDETFAPIARPETWRTLIVLALRDSWHIIQMDVVAAFLNADLKHEMYVKDNRVTGTKAWRLCKALYGLKQSAHEWNNEMTGILGQAGLYPLSTDPSCYRGEGIRIASHVDDFLVTVQHERLADELVQVMQTSIGVEVKGIPKKFLGMTCEWSKDAVTLNQQHAIENLCKLHSIQYGASTPTRSDVDLGPVTERDELADPKKYQQLIGSLLYIAQMTRPDILFLVSALARRNTKAAIRHWEAAQRVLRYLYQTKRLGHTLRAGSDVTVWVDASYGGENGRSQSGSVTCVGNTAISWSSRKQDVVALSATEAEYIAITSGAQDAVWIKRLLSELGEQITPKILTDNMGAKHLTTNSTFHRRTKHIEIRYHFIRQQLSQGELTIDWVSGKTNRADLLTKPIAGPKFFELQAAVLGSSSSK